METPQPERVPYASMAGRIQPQLLKALEQIGYTHMTPVQEKTLQLAPTNNMLVQAKTGTGKTITFLLPVLHTLLLPVLHTLLTVKNLKLS